MQPTLQKCTKKEINTLRQISIETYYDTFPSMNTVETMQAYLEIVFSKEITENGSRSRVNGMVVTQDIIKTLRELLIDIHSQHMTYTYVQPKHHITLLDNYGKAEHKELLAAYKQLFFKYMEITEKLNRAKEKIDVSDIPPEEAAMRIANLGKEQVHCGKKDCPESNAG